MKGEAQRLEGETYEILQQTIADSDQDQGEKWIWVKVNMAWLNNQDDEDIAIPTKKLVIVNITT